MCLFAIASALLSCQTAASDSDTFWASNILLVWTEEMHGMKDLFLYEGVHVCP